jgi:diguanylate cyclase (GGDEF)-like protein/PAS domain S-box-containing protein
MKSEDELNLARIDMVRRHQPGSLVLNAVGTIIVAWLAGIDHGNPWTLPWLGVGLLVVAIRGTMLLALRRNEKYAGRLVGWERLYGIGALLQGLFWGSAYFVLLPAQLLFTIFLHMLGATYAFVASATLSLSLLAFLPAVVPVVIAQAWSLWHLLGDEPFIPLMLAGCYVAVLSTGLVTFRRTILAGLRDNAARRMLLAEQDLIYNNNMAGMAFIRDGAYRRVNEALAGLLGRTRSELEGTPVAKTFPDDHSWRRAYTAVEAGLPDGVTASREYEFTDADGKRQWIGLQGRLLDRDHPEHGALWIATDITERKKAEMQLAAREQAYRNLAETYRTLIETSPAMIWTTDASGRYSFASERGTRAIFGVSASELTGKLFTEFMRPDNVERDVAAFRGVLEGRTVLDHATEGVLNDGRRISISVSGAPLHDADGKIIGATGTNVDITDRQQRAADLENARILLHNAIESISDGFAVFDREDRIVLCNRRFSTMLSPGLGPAELAGVGVEEIVRRRLARGEPIPPDFVGDTDAWVRERLRRHHAADGRPYLYETADGSWIQTTKRRTPDGGLVGIYSDITELKRSEDAIRQLAQHDALTGLPNRRLLHDRLSQAIERARRASEVCAVLLIDLDGFKPINDEHGHRAGDEVLRMVGNRLKECVRAVDTVSRYGGDEFIVVLDSLTAASGAESVALKIIEAVSRPISAVWASGHGRIPAQLQIGCSIGISAFPAEGATPDLLIRRADDAMYRAKQGGRGRFAFASRQP